MDRVMALVAPKPQVALQPAIARRRQTAEQKVVAQHIVSIIQAISPQKPAEGQEPTPELQPAVEQKSPERLPPYGVLLPGGCHMRLNHVGLPASRDIVHSRQACCCDGRRDQMYIMYMIVWHGMFAERVGISKIRAKAMPPPQKLTKPLIHGRREREIDKHIRRLWRWHSAEIRPNINPGEALQANEIAHPIEGVMPDINEERDILA
ncbi:hypothetical protein O1611_g1494 [Lasiodiplodia mahajangana]|uniref:Uncharacterized protein n=1 Tax=Lasiodiplodia mahajangana TaxID=1108764 RepID=A0ACC2JXG2_9PEZI|nr:hypothetical protein O1611_g1494 [Lasiodiplodia mahajangana]